ncbi:hypothetical protein BJ546DRAFT_960513 [Cryomyces antarcticus]
MYWLECLSLTLRPSLNHVNDGMQYVQHANRVKVAIPEIPTLFLQVSDLYESNLNRVSDIRFRKPETSLADPWLAPSIIPACTEAENSTDCEAELAIVFGEASKDVSAAEAMNYVGLHGCKRYLRASESVCTRVVTKQDKTSRGVLLRLLASQRDVS